MSALTVTRRRECGAQPKIMKQRIAGVLHNSWRDTCSSFNFGKGKFYRIPLQREKCCQQIIGLEDESFSIAVCVAKENTVLGKMFGDAVRPALCVQPIRDDLPVFHSRHDARIC